MLHVINSLGGSGGAEHGLVREITRFSTDIESLVVRMFEKDQLGHVLNNAGIEVHALGLNAARAGRNWLVARRKVVDVITEWKPDVVHTSLFSANLVGQLATRYTEVPVLSTFTLSGQVELLRRYQPGARALKASVLRGVAGFAARQTNVWFRALTQNALDTNASLLGVDPERCVVIPRGVPRRTSQVDPPHLGIPKDVPVVLNIGRQTAQKGHFLLLDAFRQVVEETPAHLAIVGRRGEISAELEERIERYALGSHVTLVGFTPEIDRYLARADVFAFSSLMEGLGTGVLEAMSVGLPVVAFDIPPVREATGDGQFASLVPAGDAASLAAALIDTLRTGPSRSRAVMEFAQSTYDLDVIASRVEGRLREVAAL